MSYHTHDLAEWTAFLSLGVGGAAAFSAPFHLFVDADLVDFDPRPALSRLVESGRVDLLLIAVADAKCDARAAVHASREACRDLAALLILLTTSPKGAMAA